MQVQVAVQVQVAGAGGRCKVPQVRARSLRANLGVAGGSDLDSL